MVDVNIFENCGEELPEHYYKYKGNFRKCAAIQVVFTYFSVKELIRVQILSKRFYYYVIPGICPKLPLPEKIDFTELMKKQQTRVMIFSKQSAMYQLSTDSNYKWISKPLAVED